MKVKSICVTLFISLFLSCNNGIEELEKRNTFLSSLAKLGNDFLSVFTSFGDSFGGTLGFNAVKSGDTGNAISAHFEKIGKGLGDTKGKLDGLAKEISSIPHADNTGVDGVIKEVSEVLTKLIDSVSRLAGVTKEAGKISDTNTSAAPPAGASAVDVKTVTEGVKAIIEIANEVAKNSGVNFIQKGNNGEQVKNATKAVEAPVGSNNNKASANAGPNLADEVSKADPWAMIAKIENAKTDGVILKGDDNNETGALAIGTNSSHSNVGAATTADLAAAVAFKAMTKTGKFSAQNDNEAVAVKAAAVSAVNKVLGIINFIIRKTINLELDKIKSAVQKIKYS
ncbi:variable large family protein (plasmid) [Borrelia coriaceae]|uniref:variable large family protein n=1 Tax=Borrelia coriaceae TaxID=144 RepID=UPI000570FC1A